MKSGMSAVGMAVVAVLAVSACSSVAVLGVDSPLKVELKEVTCDDWTVGSEDLQATVLRELDSLESDLRFSSESVLIVSGSSQLRVVFLDGSELRTTAEVLTWACDDASGATDLDSLARDLVTRGVQATCADFAGVELDVQEHWIRAMEIRHGSSVSPADLSLVCKDDESYLLDQISGALFSYLAEIRARGQSWSTSPIQMISEDGYSSTVTVSGRIHSESLTADITNSPPGFTSVTYTFTNQVTHSNNTAGRNNALLLGVAVAPAWPMSSPLCQLVMAGSRNGWEPMTPEFDWGNGAFCLPFIDPLGARPAPLEPSGSVTTANERIITHEIAESDLVVLQDALTTGSTLWVAYVSGLNMGALNMSVPFGRDDCSVFSGAYSFPIIATSEPVAVEGCTVAF